MSRALVLLVALAAVSGCVRVAPYQRGRLAHPTMLLTDFAGPGEAHVYAITDVRVMIDVGSRLILGPHLRYHAQTAADFWQRAYQLSATHDGGVSLPTYRTGDRELSWLSTVTVGASARLRLTAGLRSPWFLSFQLDAAQTRYPDALFVTRRRSLFSSLTLEAQWR